MTQECTFHIKLRLSLDAPVLATATATGTSSRGVAMRQERPKGVEIRAIESVDSHIDKFSIASLTAISFDWKTALSLALASRLAYGAATDVENTAKQRWGLMTCKFVEADDTQCFVASSPDAVLVSFRGTENLGDWLANLNVLGTTRSYGRVHRGFLGAFQVVEQQLISLLAGFPGRPMLLTGHSLGGALALIAAAEWRDKFNVSWVHTHGQPAVGKKSFQGFLESNYGDNYYRLVNDDDIVPMVPPLYRHAGRLIHFSADGGVESALGSEELEALGIDLGAIPVETPMLTEEQFDLMRAQLLQDRAAKVGAPLTEANVERAAADAAAQEGAEGLEGFFPSVADHSMDLYVAKIARQAGF